MGGWLSGMNGGGVLMTLLEGVEMLKGRRRGGGVALALVSLYIEGVRCPRVFV